ncbi:MAG: hypothetical protein U1E53_21060 [Dongiaceae bacterium]
MPAGLAAAGSPTLSTNQTLQQVLGNHQSLPGPADPGLRLQQDRAYRQRLWQQDLSKQGAARAGRQQGIQGSGAAQQQMRQRDLDTQRQQQLQYRQQQLEGEEYRYFQQLETRGR